MDNIDGKKYYDQVNSLPLTAAKGGLFTRLL